MSLSLTTRQKNQLFDLRPSNIILNDDDNFTTLHNVIADLRTYLKVNDITVLAESQFMYDDKTRVHTFELVKQAIILTCHACGNPIDVFSMYDITLQIVKL